MRIQMPGLAVSVLICTIFSSSCVINKLNPEVRTITLHPAVRGDAVQLVLERGEYWNAPMKAGPVIFNILPQIVIWTEDSKGQLAQTLYVTGAGYEKMRHAGKSQKGEAFYRECFPLWASKVEAAGGWLPSKDHPYPDTVTSATPQSGFILDTILFGPPEGGTVYAEINQSSDTNAVYTEEVNGWAGQPALVYSCRIPPEGQSVPMELAGHSGLLVSKPGIYPDLSGFDTALKQVESITIRF